MKLRNAILIGTAAIGLTLAAPNCNDEPQSPNYTTSNTDCNKCPIPCDKNYPTQRQLAISALEKRLNIEDSISVKHKILNDSTYTLTYPNGDVEAYNLEITTTPGEKPGDTTYNFDFKSILPSYARVKVVDGQARVYVY